MPEEKELTLQERMLQDFEAPETESEEAPAAEETQTITEAQASEEAENLEEAPQIKQPQTEEMPEDTLTSDEMLARVIRGGNTEQEADTTPEETKGDEDLPDFNSDEFMDKFYDNPAEAVEDAANKIADKKVKQVVSEIEKKMRPLLDQSEAAHLRSEIKDTINNFLNNNAEAKELFPDIAKYIKDNNLDPKDNRSYMDAYRESKIGKQGKEIEMLKANQGKSLNDYLSDKDSLGAMANNPELKKLVIEQYLADLQKGGKPATIGMGGTSQPVAQPTNAPKTLREAGQMLKEQLAR